MTENKADCFGGSSYEQGHYVLGNKHLVLAFFKAITTKIYHQSIIRNMGKSE